MVINDKQQVVLEIEEEIWESVQEEIDEALNAQVEDVNLMDLDIWDSHDDDNDDDDDDDDDDDCNLFCMTIPYISCDLCVWNLFSLGNFISKV